MEKSTGRARSSGQREVRCERPRPAEEGGREAGNSGGGRSDGKRQCGFVDGNGGGGWGNGEDTSRAHPKLDATRTKSPPGADGPQKPITPDRFGKKTKASTWPIRQEGKLSAL